MKVKLNAYSYLPAAMIIMLLILNVYLIQMNSVYKDRNRKLILENDSLFSVNHQLTNSAVAPKRREESLVEQNKFPRRRN